MNAYEKPGATAEERAEDNQNPWRLYAKERPTTAGVYEWRLPSVTLPGAAVTFVAHMRKRGAGFETVLSPHFDYWDGYRVHVPAGTEWRECEPIEFRSCDIANIAVEGLAFSPCIYCGKTPKLHGMQAARGGGIVCSDNAHKFNTWWLTCCQWGNTPHLSDPREIERVRTAALHAHARDVRAKALEEAADHLEEQARIHAERTGRRHAAVLAFVEQARLIRALIPTESEVGNPAALPSGLRVKRTGALLYITAATEADFIPVQVTDAEAVAFAHEVLRVVTSTGEGGE